MEIQAIRAFLMIVQTTSFSRAAEKLFLTQPAISKRIATLEFNLDCKLFDRFGKKVQLTEAGKALIPSFQKILNEVENSRHIISNLRTEVSGILKFGTSHHIGLHRLPIVLQDYTQRFPLVDLDIQFIDSEQAEALILQGKIELALVTLPDTTKKSLTTETIWQDKMDIVVSKNHALTKMKSVGVSQLLQYKVLLQSQNTHTRHIVEKALPFLTECPVLMESNYLETIKAMIERGLGWGVLPQSMIDENLQILDFKRGIMNRSLGILTHETRTLSSSAHQLLNILKNDI